MASDAAAAVAPTAAAALIVAVTIAVFVFSNNTETAAGSVELLPANYSLDELRQAVGPVARKAGFTDDAVFRGKVYLAGYEGVYPSRPGPDSQPVMPVGKPAAIAEGKAILLDLGNSLPAAAGAAAPAAAAAAGPPAGPAATVITLEAASLGETSYEVGRKLQRKLQELLDKLNTPQQQAAPRAPDVLAGSLLQPVVEPWPRVTHFLVTLITPMEGQVLQLLAVGHPDRVWWAAVGYVSLYFIILFWPWEMRAAPRRQ